MLTRGVVGAKRARRRPAAPQEPQLPMADTETSRGIFPASKKERHAEPLSGNVADSEPLPGLTIEAERSRTPILTAAVLPESNLPSITAENAVGRFVLTKGSNGEMRRARIIEVLCDCISKLPQLIFLYQN